MSFNPDKTEIMIFSNRSIPENLDFSFNGKSMPTITSPKHSDSLQNEKSECLGEVIVGIDLPLKEKSRFSGMLRLEKIMISVLSGLNDIRHFIGLIVI
jgi:hypothetical protein